jgi:hypothetical protein
VQQNQTKETEMKTTGRPAVHLPRVLGFVLQGGSNGASSRELCEALPDLSRSTIHNSALRLNEKGMLKRRESRQLVVYYGAGFDGFEIDADFVRRCKERDEDQRATKQAATDRANVKAKAGRAVRAAQRLAADAVRAAKRAAADQARREREAKQAEAIKARKRSAELAKAKLSAGRITRANAARAEMRAANAHAAAIRNDGTHEPAKAEQPAPKAVETWCAPERHQITKARPGRYEVLDVPGSFSSLKPGQYESAPVSCAARGVA